MDQPDKTMTFGSIKMEGGILSPDLLEDMARGDAKRVEAKRQATKDFDLERGVKLTVEIARE